MSKYNVATLSVASVQPKLNYRFMVSFTSFGGGSASSTSLSGYVNSFTPATFSQEPVMIDAYVSRYYVPGKHTIGQITIELRNDVENTVATAVQKQIDRQYNASKMSHAANAGSIKFKTNLIYLDGSDNVDAKAIQPKMLEAFTYTGCWITDANFGQHSYSDSNPSTISLTIQPDNMFHIFGSSVITTAFPDVTKASAASSAMIQYSRSAKSAV